MQIKVLFIYPTANGLKTYIELDNEVYYCTFSALETEAEFRVFHKDPNNVLLVDDNKRGTVLALFNSFLKEHRDDIKLGVYFADDSVFDLVFKDIEFKTESNNVSVEFSILEDRFSITELKVTNVKNVTVLDSSFSSFNHFDEGCICSDVKRKYNIEHFEHCLIIFEHLEQIMLWLSEEYRKQFIYTAPIDEKVISLF